MEFLPELFSTKMHQAISEIYAPEKISEIFEQILNIADKVKEKRTTELRKLDRQRQCDWYKEEIVYMLYAEHFAVENEENTLADLPKMFDYLEELGITTIYLLPFMDSPMGDAGFDVKNPKDVRRDLGGVEAFKQFAAKAKQRGFHLKADLVLNHFSEEHTWFQEFLAGKIENKDFFHCVTRLPEHKVYCDEKIGIVAEYQEEGIISRRRIIFPHICNSHYRKATVAGKDYYFYHTFYPFQLDINWQNPEVLYYVLDVIGFWANIGIDIFRLDAIPFLIKKKGTGGENLAATHQLIKLLSLFTQYVAPGTVLQAEACQWPVDIGKYFGEEHSIEREGILWTRSDEVQIAYHFPYMPAVWASLISKDKKHFWHIHQITPKIPPHCTWSVFLRVHDELTLEMVDAETRELLYQSLVNKGEPFREGYGVGGRMAEFLDNDPRRILQAFAILFSLPGIPIIYYGDEIGIGNNHIYAQTAANRRKERQGQTYFDARDVNRGPVSKKNFLQGQKGEIFSGVKKMIAERKKNICLTKGDISSINSPENILAYKRKYKQSLWILHNLSEAEQEVKLSFAAGNYIDILSGQIKCFSGNEQTITWSAAPYQSLWLIPSSE